MPRIISSEVAYRGYVTVTRLTAAGAGGRPWRREVVDFGQSACVLPYDPERRVALMVRLPRAPLIASGVTGELAEAPAGMLAPGETAEAAARREALEEAGVALVELQPVAIVWPSPGVLAERSHLFLAPYRAADRTSAGGGLPDEQEDIVVEETPLVNLWAQAEGGALQDLKTLTLVLALRARRPDLFAPP
jgi:nudix-type nucleoside diphosphatase (YffH/AdpP family)